MQSLVSFCRVCFSISFPLLLTEAAISWIYGALTESHRGLWSVDCMCEPKAGWWWWWWWGSWKAPSAGATQGHPRRSVSFAPGHGGVQTGRGGGVRSPHPAGLLLRSGAGNLDRRLDLCPAEPGQRGSEAAHSRGSQQGSGAELGMTNEFSFIHSFIHSAVSSRRPSVLPLLLSHCTDPLLCDQLSLSLLPRTLHRLHC